MLAIGVFAPFDTDHARNLAFCRDADVHHLILSAARLAADGLPSSPVLQELVAQYASVGVVLSALTPPRLSLQACIDGQAREKELGYMSRLLENMGRAGIPFLHLYLSTQAAPVDPGERARHWEGLVEMYRGLAAFAEQAGVRVSTHTYHRPDRLLWNSATMSRLLEEVPAPFHGLTFCQGKSQLAGDHLADTIRAFGERIFMVHVRDIVTRPSGPTTPEIDKRLTELGYLEVPFGRGEVDMVGTIRALKQIDYQGQLYPEHFPAIAGDHAAGLAWTIGYLRALDQAVEA
jgi:sugar phosphate isomerase/epimerase